MNLVLCLQLYAVAGDVLEAIRMVTVLSDMDAPVDRSSREALITCGVLSGPKDLAHMLPSLVDANVIVCHQTVDIMFEMLAKVGDYQEAYQLLHQVRIGLGGDAYAACPGARCKEGARFDLGTILMRAHVLGSPLRCQQCSG